MGTSLAEYFFNSLLDQGHRLRWLLRWARQVRLEERQARRRPCRRRLGSRGHSALHASRL